MRFHRLDLNLLVCLDALIAERSVSRAAERVYLGQSAMSSALARLRTHFKDPLLVQSGRAMTPTPLAQGLAKPVRDVLLQIQAITAHTPAFDPMKSERPISLIASDYVTSVFLPRLIPRLEQLAPHIRLDIRNFGPRFREEFDSGEADMMIVPAVFQMNTHPSETLFDDTFSCVVWRDNKSVGTRLTAERYLAMGHVGIEWSGGRLRSVAEEVLRMRGTAPRIEVVAPSFALVAPLLVGTQRIAMVQTRLAHLLAEQWPLRIIRCPIATTTITELAQWHTHVDSDPAIVWFRALLRAVAAELNATKQGGAGRRRAVSR